MASIPCVVERTVAFGQRDVGGSVWLCWLSRQVLAAALVRVHHQLGGGVALQVSLSVRRGVLVFDFP